MRVDAFGTLKACIHIVALDVGPVKTIVRLSAALMGLVQIIVVMEQKLLQDLV